MRKLLLVGIAFAVVAGAQTGEQVASELAAQGVPVERAGVENGAAVALVRYDAGVQLDPATVRRHMTAVFSRLASAYPSADLLILGSYVGEQPVSRAGIDAQTVRAYLANQISETALIGRTRLHILVDFEKELASPAPAYAIDPISARAAPAGEDTMLVVVLGICAAGAIVFFVVAARRRARPAPALGVEDPVEVELTPPEPPRAPRLRARKKPSAPIRRPRALRVVSLLLLGSVVVAMLTIAGAESDATEQEAPFYVVGGLIGAAITAAAIVVVWRRR